MFGAVSFVWLYGWSRKGVCYRKFLERSKESDYPSATVQKLAVNRHRWKTAAGVAAQNAVKRHASLFKAQKEAARES